MILEVMGQIISFLFGGHSDGPVVEIEVFITQKVLEHLPVAGMVRQVFVVLRGNGSNLPQIPPRAGREIMMLSMVPQIDVGNIPPSEVIVRFLTLDELVVLGNDVDGCRVRSDRGKS